MNMISRRSVLGGIAALPATAAPGHALTGPEAQDIGPTAQRAPAAVLALIDAHRRARVEYADAGELLHDLRRANPMPIFPGVQVGNLIKDGQRRPVMARSIEAVRIRCEDDRSTLLRFHGRKNRAAIDRDHHARVARLTAELRQQQDEVRQRENAAGITAAREAVDLAERRMERSLGDMLAFRPATLAESAEIANYLVECYASGVTGFDDERPFALFTLRVATLTNRGDESGDHLARNWKSGVLPIA